MDGTGFFNILASLLVWPLCRGLFVPLIAGLEGYEGLVLLEVDILISTEILGERYAREVLAPGAVVDRSQVEDH